MLRKERTTVLPYMEEGNSDVAKSDRRYADESFAQFWAVYPRKVAKIAAKRKWDALRPTPELVRQIMAALEWQIPSWTEDQFIPHPATWLHNGRWEDEKPTPRVNGTPRDLERSWSDVLKCLNGHVSEDDFATYVQHMTPAIDGGTGRLFTVMVPTLEFRERIPTEVETQLREAVAKALPGRGVQFMWTKQR
jgi:hypothetical protein